MIQLGRVVGTVTVKELAAECVVFFPWVWDHLYDCKYPACRMIGLPCTPSFPRAQRMVLDDGLHLSPAFTMPHTKAGNVGGCHGYYNYGF